MKRFKAVVNVGLKPTIKDIKAITLKDAVSHLIETENFNCKAGSRYVLEFDAENSQKADETVKLIAKEILSNSVIETYEISWENPNE